MLSAVLFRTCDRSEADVPAVALWVRGAAGHGKTTAARQLIALALRPQQLQEVGSEKCISAAKDAFQQ